MCNRKSSHPFILQTYSRHLFKEAVESRRDRKWTRRQQEWNQELTSKQMVANRTERLIRSFPGFWPGGSKCPRKVHILKGPRVGRIRWKISDVSVHVEFEIPSGHSGRDAPQLVGQQGWNVRPRRTCAVGREHRPVVDTAQVDAVTRAGSEAWEARTRAEPWGTEMSQPAGQGRQPRKCEGKIFSV